MGQETKTLADLAWDELFATVCACGSKKEIKRSFCHSCYFALPHKTRTGLYKSFSDGYAEIYAEAKELLKAEGRIR